MRSFLTNVGGEESRDGAVTTSAWEARYPEQEINFACFELERVRVAGSGLYAFLNGLLLPLPFRLRSPQACSGMIQSRNFNKIYLNSIKHGHNIKLSLNYGLLQVLNFCITWPFITVLLREEKSEKTYNKYLLKHQHISMAIPVRNLSWMAYCLRWFPGFAQRISYCA